MKANRGFILIVIISAMCGCTKSENELLSLDGTWVEISTRSDTLVFTQFGTEPALELRRGLENRNGYMLPEYGAGFYLFKIDGEMIALQDLLSSSMVFENYYFSQHAGGLLEIGNFYNKNIRAGENITFLRIE